MCSAATISHIPVVQLYDLSCLPVPAYDVRDKRLYDHCATNLPRHLVRCRSNSHQRWQPHQHPSTPINISPPPVIPPASPLLIDIQIQCRGRQFGTELKHARSLDAFSTFENGDPPTAIHIGRRHAASHTSCRFQLPPRAQGHGRAPGRDRHNNILPYLDRRGHDGWYMRSLR